TDYYQLDFQEIARACRDRVPPCARYRVFERFVGMTPRRVVAFLLLFCTGMFAQDYRATIVGTVTDPSGSSIPNAAIKATNAATNSVTETKSSSDGLYTLPFLEPGVYRVEASAPGFQTLRRESVTVAVGQRMNLPIQLAVGQATTEIT